MPDPVMILDGSGAGAPPEIRPPTPEEQAAIDAVAADVASHIVFSADRALEGKVQTTDATPAEVVRLTLERQTGYTGQVSIIGVDGGNGAVRVIRASFAVKRLNAGALSVGAPVVIASHADSGATAWAINQSVAGNDVVVSVTGAAGRTIDWYCNGQIMSFAPGGVA